MSAVTDPLAEPGSAVGGTTRFLLVPSPVGELLLTTDEDTALTGLYLSPHRDRPAVVPGWAPGGGLLEEARRQLDAYFARELTGFDLPLAPRGTPFQLRVWQALREIPYGSTWSYGMLARRLGSPGASRAVGLANGRNPISIIVPCHRVIGSTGKPVGYGGGLARKVHLLTHEGALTAGHEGAARLF